MFTDNTEELAQNKLILLYIIKKSPQLFTKEGINNYILENNYMNYFFLQQYLLDLVNSKFISYSLDKETGEYIYKLEKEGDLTLNYFSSKIPEDIKNKLHEDFKISKKNIEIKTQVLSEYYKNDSNEYIVNLKLVENQDTLFSLYLNVVSEDQAKIIENKWKESTDEIYSKVMNIFIN